MAAVGKRVATGPKQLRHFHFSFKKKKEGRHLSVSDRARPGEEVTCPEFTIGRIPQVGLLGLLSRWGEPLLFLHPETAELPGLPPPPPPHLATLTRHRPSRDPAASDFKTLRPSQALPDTSPHFFYILFYFVNIFY